MWILDFEIRSAWKNDLEDQQTYYKMISNNILRFFSQHTLFAAKNTFCSFLAIFSIKAISLRTRFCKIFQYLTFSLFTWYEIDISFSVWIKSEHNCMKKALIFIKTVFLETKCGFRQIHFYCSSHGILYGFNTPLFILNNPAKQYVKCEHRCVFFDFLNFRFF